MNNKDKFYLSIIIVLILFSLYVWYKEKPNKVVILKPSHGQLPEIPTSKPTGTVACTNSGIETKTVDNTPQWIKDSTSNEVMIANGVVSPWKAETDVYAFLDVNTGKSRLLYDQREYKENRSLFEYENNKELGVYYGYGNNGRALQISGRWDLFRVGEVHLGTKMDVNITDKTEALVLVGGSYRWK